MSLHVITQSQRPILKLYVPELNIVYSRKDLRGTYCLSRCFQIEADCPLAACAKLWHNYHFASCEFEISRDAPCLAGSKAGSKLKPLPMCAKSVCHRLKRFALANKESQGHGKAPEVVVSYHLPLLIGFIRFGCSSSELHASEFEISPCCPLSLVQADSNQAAGPCYNVLGIDCAKECLDSLCQRLKRFAETKARSRSSLGQFAKVSLPKAKEICL